MNRVDYLIVLGEGGNHESYNDCLLCAGGRRPSLEIDGLGDESSSLSGTRDDERETFIGSASLPLLAARGSSETLLLIETAEGRRGFLLDIFKASASFIASNFICTTLILSSLISCAVRLYL